VKTGPIIVAIIAVGWLAARTAASEERRTFVGDISDSQCALNVHSLTRSHQEMLKSKSMGGSAAECANYCVKYLGGDYVLSSKVDVYRLDEQGEAAKFAGQTVKLVGVLGPKKTIHVISIGPDPKATTSDQNTSR
jgi:hypothetical protein